MSSTVFQAQGFLFWPLSPVDTVQLVSEWFLMILWATLYWVFPTLSTLFFYRTHTLVGRDHSTTVHNNKRNLMTIEKPQLLIYNETLYSVRDWGPLLVWEDDDGGRENWPESPSFYILWAPIWNRANLWFIFIMVYAKPIGCAMAMQRLCPGCATAVHAVQRLCNGCALAISKVHPDTWDLTSPMMSSHIHPGAELLSAKIGIAKYICL